MTEDVARVAREAAAEALRQHTQQVQRNPDQINDIVDRAVSETLNRTLGPATTKAVAESLATFGIDTNNRMDFMRDLIFLREMRILSSDSKRHVLLSVLAVVTTAVVGGFIAYAKLSGKTP